VRRRWIAAAAGSLLLGLLASPLVHAQVQIIRQLPPTEENKVQPDWGSAIPTADSPPTPGVQLGGRLALGGTGGVNDQGVQTADAFIDSSLSLMVPLSSSSRALFKGDAGRKAQLDGLEQGYKGGASLLFDAWQADVGGSFQQQDRNNSTALSHDMSADAHAALTLGFIPTLPVLISWSYQHQVQSNAPATVGGVPITGASPTQKDELGNRAQLKAAGTLGSIGVDSGASFADIADSASGMHTTGFGGSLGVTVPLASFLKAYATFTPAYSSINYAQTGNSVTTTSLGSELGVILPVSEPLSFKLGVGRVDLWSAQAGPGADPAAVPYSVIWQGIAGVAWKQATGFSADSTYTLGKTVSGPLIHGLKASAQYQGEKDAVLKNAGADGSASLSVNDAGSPVDGHAAWKAGVTLGNQDTLALVASYNGGVDGLDASTWSNAGHLSFNHQLAPELGYSVGADVSASINPNTPSTFDQQYLAKVAWSPRLGDRTYSFGLDETVGLGGLSTPIQAVSKAGASVQVPVLSVLGMRYRFEWEWDSQTAPGAGPDSIFHHVAGMTLSGPPLPFSLSAEYGLSHGFRGVRHDVMTALSVGITKSLSIQGNVNLSIYDTTGSMVVPFLASLLAAYQF
jgi:hypothetical protein